MFFSSVKLAAVLLIILAVVSVIGTVIQQNQAPEDYLREYSMATVGLFEALGFFDLYHTWWFVLILLLFTANLTICTLERFPAAWKVMQAPLKTLEEAGYKAAPFKREISVKGGAEKAEAAALKALHGKRYRPLDAKEQGATHLASQKGAYSRMCVYVTHVSIIMIFIGALIGSFFGFKGFLNLPENQVSSVVYLRNETLWDKIMAGFGIGKSSARELVDVRRKRPTVLNAAIGFTGSTSHLAAELLKQIAELKFTTVSYKGGGMSMVAVMSGEVDFHFAVGGLAARQLKSGKVRPLAVTTATPSEYFPGLPTMHSYLPGFVIDEWFALYFPAGTRPEIVATVNGTLQNALENKLVRAFLAGEALTAIGSSPEDLGAYLRRETSRYADIIRQGNISVD